MKAVFSGTWDGKGMIYMKELINREWEYRSEVTGNQWKNVTIPHTPKIEEFNVGLPFQGLSYYT